MKPWIYTYHHLSRCVGCSGGWNSRKRRDRIFWKEKRFYGIGGGPSRCLSNFTFLFENKKFPRSLNLPPNPGWQLLGYWAKIKINKQVLVKDRALYWAFPVQIEDFLQNSWEISMQITYENVEWWAEQRRWSKMASYSMVPHRNMKNLLENTKFTNFFLRLVLQESGCQFFSCGMITVLLEQSHKIWGIFENFTEELLKFENL